jgi:hypothetical protein
MTDVGEIETSESKSEVPLPPVEKIVQHLQLENVTMEGWEVIESLSYDGVIEYVEQVPPDPMAQGYQPPRYINRTQVGRLVGFRVRKKGGDVLARLTRRISSLEEWSSSKERETREAQDKLQKETQSHEITKGKLGEAVKVAADAHQLLKEMKAERDLTRATNESLEKELADFERVKRVFGLRAVSDALMKSDAVDVLEEASPKEGS